MAATMFGVGRRGLINLCKKSSALGNTVTRSISSSCVLHGDNDDKASWMKRMLRIRTVDPGTQSHSQALGDKDTVYELQMHSVKPEFMEQYLQEYQSYVQLTNEKGTGAELLGSWTVEIGDQDEAIHLWKYPGGYANLNNTTQIYRTDKGPEYNAALEKEFVQFRANRNKMLRSRKNQILLAFTFWGDILPRKGTNIYELRSYVLKPGTMIEWGNNWARGLAHRRNENEAVCGYFSHLGDLFNVHHFWSYESLQSRKEIREQAWARPGWDECVSYTVPLIRHMTTRILIPTPFSPLQ